MEKQIIEQATRLFAERGFASTTLQDIADATGLTRPALYHYVANKDELLSRLVSESTETPAALLHTINERTDLGPTEKLREMATAIALHQAQAPDRFRLIIRSEAELPEDISRNYEQSRRHVLKEFIHVVEDGIRTGEMRPVDPRTAAGRHRHAELDRLVASAGKRRRRPSHRHSTRGHGGTLVGPPGPAVGEPGRSRASDRDDSPGPELPRTAARRTTPRLTALDGNGPGPDGGHARRSASTGIVRMPAVFSAYSAKPGYRRACSV